jgi:hypothetical protein
MKNGITLKRQFRGRHKGVRQHLATSELSTLLSNRVPRISRLMALAIRFDHLIRDGVVADQADLSRLGHVSRARLTQIMNLLNLAPDLQEEILQLSTPTHGRRLTERQLRPIVAKDSWEQQRRLWRNVIRAANEK